MDNSHVFDSDLEHEVELEMDDVLVDYRQNETDLVDELEADRQGGAHEDFEVEDDLNDRETSEDLPFTDTRYGERFYELSSRRFESELEAESEVNGILFEIERDYFFGRLKKALKKGVK